MAEYQPRFQLADNSSNSLSLGGAISTTVTWSGSGPRPACVVVEQDCTVGWSGSTGAVTGSCSNPLGGSASSLSPAGQTWTYSKYTVVNTPGTTIPVADCGPTANVTVPTSVGGGVSVEYCVTIHPVNINLAGTTPDGSGGQDILVGQGCTSSVVGLPSTPSGTTFTYSWNIHGITFQTWQATTPETLEGPANTQASYYVGGPGLLSLPTASWYWNDASQTTETVSCAVTVTPPTGQGSSFTVSPSQNVTVMLPSFTGTGVGGYMQVNTSAPDDSNYELWAGPTAPMEANGTTGGMNWDLSVTTPPMPAFGLGNLELVQIVTPNLTYSANGGATQTYSPGTGLDGEYPYASGQELSGDLMSRDSPGMGLVNMIFTVTQATFTPGFTDYLMYEPPNSTQFVPVGIFVWSTSGSASLPAAPNNNWSQYSTVHGGDPADAAGTVNAPNVNFVQTNSFPSWTQIIKVSN